MQVLKPVLCVAGALTIALLLSAPANAQFTRDPEAIEAYEAGIQLLKQEKWEEAISAFTVATQKDKTYPEAFQGLGDALRELEDYPTAIVNYGKATDINPNLALAFYGRGICYREQGELQMAGNDFDNASQLDRTNADIAADWGAMLVNEFQDPGRGKRYLDIAIARNPENAEAYRNRGWAYTRLRDFEEALKDLNRSIEIDPNDFETHTRLAALHEFHEEFLSAISSYTNAIATYKPKENTDPDTYVNGYLQRASAELRLANQVGTPEEQRQDLYQAIIADADSVLSEFPDRFPESGHALHRRGVALRLQGRLGEAIKALTDAIQLSPGGGEGGYVAEAYLKRGICWHYQEQGSLARGDFEEAAALNFEDPLPHLWIGFTYAQEGDYREAIENYGEAIARRPGFPLIYVNRGLAYIQMGEYDKGVENFNEAIRHESDDATKARHFYKRGLAYMLLEQYQKAFESFDHAMLNDNSYQEAFSKAAAALRKMGKSSLAEQYDRRASELPAPTP